jgi:hypothetical protein
MSTFDRTRAECMVSSESCVRTYRVSSNACVQGSVCVCWGATVEHMKVSSYAAPCTRSNVHDTFERRVQRKMFFFFKELK